MAFDHDTEFCGQCGEPMNSYFVTDGTKFCDLCYYFKDPPTLKLVKTPHHGGKLFNPVIDRYEMYMDMEKFIRCGWFLRKEEIMRDSTIYTLEYHGPLKCKRCNVWQKTHHFPHKFEECVAQICNNYIPIERMNDGEEADSVC